MTKVDWLAASAIGLLLAYSLQNLSANGKQGPVPEEIFQPLLTNKKRAKTRLRDATNIIKPI
jgi:hypothetical protein